MRQGASRPDIKFLPRDAMHKRGLCSHAVSVCLCVCVCVCPSRSWTVSKRINIFSKFFSLSGIYTILVFHTKWDGNIPTGTPLTGRGMQVV